MEVVYKYCSSCRKNKILNKENFYFRLDRPITSRYSTYCIECEKEKRKENYRNNKEKYLIYSKGKYQELLNNNPNHNVERYQLNKEYQQDYDAKRNKDLEVAKKRAEWQYNYRRQIGLVTGDSRSLEEKQIAEFLTKEQINFKSEVKLGCLSKKGSDLFFDFFIPNRNLIIEYDGVTHYHPIYGEKTLKRMQENDQIKDKFCKVQGINLVRISYKEDIKEVLCQIVK